MNIKEIVVDYLGKHGFEALVNPEHECGCSIDDLCPMETEGMFNCEPGYKTNCKKCGDVYYTTQIDRILSVCPYCGYEEKGV